MDGWEARVRTLATAPRGRAGAGRSTGGAGLQQVAPRGLQLEQDPTFQRREQRVGTWGWRALVGLLVVALLGGLGSGVLSWGRASSPDGTVQVTHERVVHRDGDASLSIDVARGPAPLQVELGGPWLQHVQVVQVSPEPTAQTVTADGLRLAFDLAGAQPVRVRVWFQPQDAGLAAATVTVAGATARFRQVVLP